MRAVWIVILAALSLGGCAAIPVTPDSNPSSSDALWASHQRAVAERVSWNLLGRISLRTSDMAASATLRWIRNGGQDDIYLFGPLGGGKVQLSISADAVTLRDAKGQVVTGANPSELLYRVTGWHIPFEALDDWIRGVPSSEPIGSMVLGPEGQLKNLNQSGWDIAYLEFMSVNDLPLPQKIRIAASEETVESLVLAGQMTGDRLALRFFIESWDPQ